MGLVQERPGLGLEGWARSPLGTRDRMKAGGPRHRLRFWRRDAVPRGTLWPRVAEPGAVCSRSLTHATLHFRPGEEKGAVCCG